MGKGAEFDLQHQQFAWVTDIYISNPFLAYVENVRHHEPDLSPIFQVMSADTALISSLDFFDPTKLTSYEPIKSVSIHTEKPVLSTFAIEDLQRVESRVNADWQWLNNAATDRNLTHNWQNIFPLYTEFLNVIPRTSHCWLLFANPTINNQSDCWEVGAEPLFLGYADEVTLDNLESGMGALSPVLGNLAKLVTENNVSVVPHNQVGGTTCFSVPLAYIEIPTAALLNEAIT